MQLSKSQPMLRLATPYVGRANIFPPLHETEELLLRLFIYNSNDSLITSYQKLLPPHSTLLSAEYILLMVYPQVVCTPTHT